MFFNFNLIQTKLKNKTFKSNFIIVVIIVLVIIIIIIIAFIIF